MAGSEHSGVSHAEALLFENATYVLCPPGGLSESAFTAQYAGVIALFESTGARLLVLEAAQHDRIAAAVSHLPQLLAVLLMNFAAEKNEEDEAYLRLAAGGFRDLTRIASSPFIIWRDILIANQGHLLDVMAQFAVHFQKMRNRLIEEDLLDLQQSFQTARSSRQSIPKNTKGFLHPLSDVFVYVEDHPGALLGIVQALYEAELNIKDIELLKMREGTGGTFRLGFKDNGVAKAAVSALQERAYTAFQL
jgi:prephenate dehydrogenase